MPRKKSTDITRPAADEDKIEWMIEAVILQAASIKELAHEARVLRESIAAFCEQYQDALHEQAEAIPHLAKEIEILRVAIDDLRQEYEDAMRRQARLVPPTTNYRNATGLTNPVHSPIVPPEESPSLPTTEPGSLW